MRPKLWNGANAVGEAKARFNRVIDSPYLTATGAGFVANKKGPFAEVLGPPEEPPPTPLLRFFCMGRIAGVDQLSGSFNAKYTFRQLGNVNAYNFGIPSIGYIGGGYGAIYKVDTTAYPPFLVVDLYITKDGRRFKKTYTITTRVDPDLFYFAQLVTGTQRSGKKRTWSYGLVGLERDSVYYNTYYHYTAATRTWGVTPLLRYTGNDCFSYIKRVGVTTLLAVTFVYYPSVPVVLGDGGVLVDPNPTNAPKPFLQRSTDNGVTWESHSLDALFSDFAGAAGYDVVNYFYTLMRNDVGFIPVTPDKTLLIMPFVKHVAYDAYGFETTPAYEYRVYAITRIGLGLSVSKIATLSPAQVSARYGVMQATPTLANSSCVLCQWAPENPAASPGKLCLSFDEGVTWEYRALPWANGYTGFVSWIDPETLVCPVYDGEHSLYETKDFGSTWNKRATIRTDGDAPSPSDPFLRYFNTLVQFLDERYRPASFAPGAPWIDDVVEP